MLNRSEDTLELLKDPFCLVLLTQIAIRALRTPGGLAGLEVGEALVGDHERVGLTRQQYRSALGKLETAGYITEVRSTNKGTVVGLHDSRVYNINAEGASHWLNASKSAVRGFLMLNRSEDTNEFLGNPQCFVLLTQIALRARRRPGGLEGLGVGEALVGDHQTIGLSRQEYRTALTKLKDGGYVAVVRSTGKGTVVRLADNRVYDINVEGTNQRLTTHQPSGNLLSTTNKNEKKEEEINKEKNLILFDFAGAVAEASKPPKDPPQVNWNHLRKNPTLMKAFKGYLLRMKITNSSDGDLKAKREIKVRLGNGIQLKEIIDLLNGSDPERGDLLMGKTS